MSLDRIKAIKERAMSIVEQGLNQDVSCIDSKELYEAMDVLKDAFEACKLYHESEYYEKISKAMDESKEEDKTMKMMEKYLPEMSYARSYTSYPRYYTMGNGGRPRRNYSSNGSSSSPSGNSEMRNYMPYESYDDMYDTHNMYDGESWKHRRNYMEHMNTGDKSEASKNLEEYMKSLTDDIMEMIEHMGSDEKVKLKQKIATLAGKIS